MRAALVFLVACGYPALPRLVQDADNDGAQPIDAPPFDAPPIPTGHNIMFVTSMTHNGNFGGIQGADVFCQNAANAAGVPGSYFAWMSTPTSTAASRLFGRGWVRRDGKPFADMQSDLETGKLITPPRINELGYELGHVTVWTATRYDGSYNTSYFPDTCSGWTSNAANAYPGGAGFSDNTGLGWTDHINPTNLLPCSAQAHVYCFGTSMTQPVTITPATGFTAFLTHMAWTPGGGIGSADAVCASEATAFGLPGTYLALLSTRTASAASRFASVTQPFVRKDGIVLAATPQAFFARQLDAPLNFTSDGTYDLGNPVFVGAQDFTKPGVMNGQDFTCNDWNSSSSGMVSFVAESTASTPANLTQGTFPCNLSARLFCLRAQ